MIKRPNFRLSILAAFAWLLLLMPAWAAEQAAIGKAMYGVWPLEPGTKVLSAIDSATTIPHWSSTFRFKGATYSYRMAGTSPFEGSATTTVRVQILPLRFVFANGAVLDGTTRVAALKNSPLFMATTFSSGTTQYVDAIQRAEFWTVVENTSPDYHLLLSTPEVLPARTIQVPWSEGVQFAAASGQPVGLVDMDWFSAQLNHIFATSNLSPSALAMVLDYNVFFYLNHNFRQCCVLGFHGAFAPRRNRINTFAFAAYSDPGLFSMEDVTAMSHEVAEWANDPFLNNVVPLWAVPGETKCFSNLLEGGDPISVFDNLAFEANVNGTTYHLQDVAGISWFARQAPPMQQNGKYSYAGLLSSTPPACH